MLKFLQVFGLGILYVVLSPFFVLILALYVVFTAVIMVYLFFKMIILFFAGKNLFGDLPEDIKAREILDQQKQLRQAQAMAYQQAGPLPPFGYGPQGQPQPVINHVEVKEIQAAPLPEKDEVDK